jgi:hypothetical protein
MDAHENGPQTESPAKRDNVIPLRPRQQSCVRTLREPAIPQDFQRFPVDIRGQITLGRLMDGLSSVGLTIRMDAQSGRIVITDDAWE